MDFTQPKTKLLKDEQYLSFPSQIRRLCVGLSKHLTIYTDGSKMDSGTGTGVCSTKPSIGLSVPLGAYTSFYQAKICVVAPQDENVMEKERHICTDILFHIQTNHYMS